MLKDEGYKARQERLDRLEALHRRGRWPFVWKWSLYIVLPSYCLGIPIALAYELIYGNDHTTLLEWAITFVLFPIYCVGGGLLARTLVPKFLLLARMVPPETPREKESSIINLIGAIVLAAVTGLTIYSLEAQQVNVEHLGGIAMLWTIGSVVSLWGLVGVIQGHMKNPEWRAARPGYRMLSICIGFILRSSLLPLTAIPILMLWLKWQGKLEVVLWEIKRFFGF